MILQSIFLANLVKSIVSLSSYYPVDRLAKFQIYGYIRYPDSKNY